MAISMVTVYDVPSDKLIRVLAEKLKKEKLAPPEWSAWVTTGVHKEKGPSHEEWWYVRMASVLRKVYVKGPIGTSKLAAEYGGKEDRGSKRYKARKGSRSITRKCLQQLETLGYVKKDKKGRVITSKGQSFVDNAAKEAMDSLLKERPELEKYAK